MSRRTRETGGLVYSTEHGEMCPECRRPAAACSCGKGSGRRAGQGDNRRQGRGAASQRSTPPGGSGVRVGRETKGRKGKGVTVITGLPLDPAKLKELAKELKSRCGSGGTVKDGVIEIQGDHRDLLVEELARRGWPARRSGG